MSKEQLIRETAYAIWEAEGRPDGQDEAHWARAEELVNEQTSAEAALEVPGAPAPAVSPSLSVGGD